MVVIGYFPPVFDFPQVCGRAGSSQKHMPNFILYIQTGMTTGPIKFMDEVLLCQRVLNHPSFHLDEETLFYITGHVFVYIEREQIHRLERCQQNWCPLMVRLTFSVEMKEHLIQLKLH